MFGKITTFFEKKKLATLLAFPFLLLPSLGYCSNATGTVALLEIVAGPAGLQNQELAFVSPSIVISAPPACNTYNRYVIDLGTVSGKAIYVALLQAKQAGTTVKFYGSGTCSLYGNSETLVDIQH